MADLYITYGLRETSWVNKLVTILDDEGFTICWEHAVAPGDDVRTDDSIQALNNAKCVLAVWSDTSVDDFWVLSDAERAVAQNKLISVVAKSAVIPRAFRQSETVFMQSWDVQTKDEDHFNKLLKIINQFATPSQASQSEREHEKLARQVRMKAESERRHQVEMERENRAKLRRTAV